MRDFEIDDKIFLLLIVGVAVVFVFATAYVGFTAVGGIHNEKITSYFFYSDYTTSKSLRDLVASEWKELNVTFCSVDGKLTAPCERVAKNIHLGVIPTLVIYEGNAKVVLEGGKKIRSYLEGTAGHFIPYVPPAYVPADEPESVVPAEPAEPAAGE